MEGKIRSSFAMTEKGVASSDATNIGLSIRKEGNEIVVNGHKWWMYVYTQDSLYCCPTTLLTPRWCVVRALATLATEFTSSWERAILLTPTRTNNNPSSSYPLTTPTSNSFVP
jgi:hypothetical protein